MGCACELIIALAAEEQKEKANPKITFFSSSGSEIKILNRGEVDSDMASLLGGRKEGKDD